MDIPVAIILGACGGAATVIGGIYALIRLSFSDLLVKNDVVTAHNLTQHIKGVLDKIDSLRELVEFQIGALPCKTGTVCGNHRGETEIHMIRETMDIMQRQISAFVNTDSGKG